jgi:regulator of nucleoside diphosphate kinase
VLPAHLWRGHLLAGLRACEGILNKSSVKKTIYITEADKAKLEKLLAEEILKTHDGFSRLEGLTKELMKAQVVESADVPSDVITMNSKVLLKHLEREESEEYVLVFPKHANERMQKVSILSPIGTAMIGCRVGHVFRVKTQDGERQMMVEQILYQPEAAGDYHL